MPQNANIGSSRIVCGLLLIQQSLEISVPAHSQDNLSKDTKLKF